MYGVPFRCIVPAFTQFPVTITGRLTSNTITCFVCRNVGKLRKNSTQSNLLYVLLVKSKAIPVTGRGGLFGL
jgi:hypothetical protein